MKNKKGFAITGMLIVLIAVLVGLAGFLFSTKLRFILIGIGILVGTFYVIGQMVSGSVTKTKVIVVIILISVGMFFILGANVLQQSFSGGDYIELKIDNNVATCENVLDCRSFMEINTETDSESIKNLDLKCDENVCKVNIPTKTEVLR